MTLHRVIRDHVRNIFETHWPPAPGVPVLWHANDQPIVPDSGTTRHWLHLTVEFGTDAVRAYGAGRLANEWLQFGSVHVRVFAASGAGDDTALDLLSAAIAAFRSRRDGPLSFIGAIAGIDDGGTEDGAWWMRGAVVGFEYRHTG